MDPETGIVTFTNPITDDVTVTASYDRVTSFHLSRPATAVVSVKNKATNTVLNSSLYTFDPATGTVVVKTPLATNTDFEIVYDQDRSALLLSQAPRTATISVSVDGTPLSSSSFSYDTSTQKLSFVNYTLPAAGTVTVNYQSRILLTLKSRVDSAGLLTVMFNGAVLAPSAYTLDASAGTIELLTATVPTGQTRTAVVAYQVLDWVSDIYTIQKSDLTASGFALPSDLSLPVADTSSVTVSVIDHAKANDNDPDNDLTFKLQPSDFVLSGDGKTVTLNVASSKLPDGFGSSVDVQVRYLRRSSMQVTVNGTALAVAGYTVNLFNNTVSLTTAPADGDAVEVTYEVGAPKRVIVPDISAQPDAPGNKVELFGRNTDSVTGTGSDYFVVTALDGVVTVTWQGVTTFTVLHAARTAHSPGSDLATDQLEIHGGTGQNTGDDHLLANGVEDGPDPNHPRWRGRKRHPGGLSI